MYHLVPVLLMGPQTTWSCRNKAAAVTRILFLFLPESWSICLLATMVLCSLVLPRTKKSFQGN